MFVKLFSSILDSSIWSETVETRIVWVTLLAMADRQGNVRVSPTGLARRANVPLSACRDAVKVLEGPDVESASQEWAGRRIEPVEGGWMILNYKKYRGIRDAEDRKEQTRTAVRKHRAGKAPKADVSHGKPATAGKPPTEAEAKTEADKQDLPAEPAGHDTWLTPYLQTYETAVGVIKPGRLAAALKPVHDAAGAEKALALFARWCGSDKAGFGPEWFAANWKRADKPTSGKQRPTTIADKNYAQGLEQFTGGRA